MYVVYHGLNSPLIIDTLCLWFHVCWTNLIMPKCTPRLTYVEHTTWCAFEKMMNGKWCLKLVMTILNMLWCPLTLLMHMLSFNIWGMMFSMGIWMILWFVTLMTSSFFWRKWHTMNATYVLFWKSFGKLVFMSNWKNVDSINLRWNSWVILFLEMVFAWTLVRFKPLWIGLP